MRPPHLAIDMMLLTSRLVVAAKRERRYSNRSLGELTMIRETVFTEGELTS
jgi:hypothetical protein